MNTSLVSRQLSACPVLASRRSSLATRRAPSTQRAAAATRTVSMASRTEDLPANLAKIVGAFQMVPDPMQRYKQLLFFAAKLKNFPEEARTEDNKVPGCVSQVWVQPRMEGDLVYFTADSDSQLTKGLAALLVEGLSGKDRRDDVRNLPTPPYPSRSPSSSFFLSFLKSTTLAAPGELNR